MASWHVATAAEAIAAAQFARFGYDVGAESRELHSGSNGNTPLRPLCLSKCNGSGLHRTPNGGTIQLD